MKVDLYGTVWTDCQPAVVLRSKRKIMPGEELTISYYPEDMCVGVSLHVFTDK
jgi:hypothetical protein